MKFNKSFRLTALLLWAVLLWGLGSCSVFNEANYELTEYSNAQTEDSSSEDAGYISDYDSLKRAITALVADHTESALLQFQNYDGNLTRDLSTACWEVKSSTPLGAYAVDYTSFDLSQIVSYTQADLYITYKRSAEQLARRETVSGLTGLSTRLSQALSNGETYLVLQLRAAALSEDWIADELQSLWYGDARLSPVLPELSVTLYPESGVERLAEITLDYGLDDESLAALRQRYEDALQSSLEDLQANLAGWARVTDAPEDIQTVCAVLRYLQTVCVCDPEAGSTAADALLEHSADSEGLAMACSALCRSLGLDCEVVRGLLDIEQHSWNLIHTDLGCFHLDSSVSTTAAVPLFGDDTLRDRYRWDSDTLPACPLDYEQARESSAEPAQTAD